MPEIVVESLEGLDDSLKAVYTEKDGKFQLDPDKYSEFRASGLKKKNQEILGKLNESKSALKRYEKLAEVDDDEIEELLTLRANKGKDTSTDDKAAEERFNKLLDKERKRFEAEKQPLTSKLGEYEQQLRHYRLTVPLKDIAVKAGIFPEDLDLVMLDTAKRFQLDDDGKIVVLDEDGDPASGVTPKTFFETLYKEMRPKFYTATGAGGSGAQGNTQTKSTGKKTISRTEWQALTPAESSKFFAEGGTLKD
jgi:hypothetical protein